MPTKPHYAALARMLAAQRHRYLVSQREDAGRKAAAIGACVYGTADPGEEAKLKNDLLHEPAFFTWVKMTEIVVVEERTALTIPAYVPTLPAEAD